MKTLILNPGTLKKALLSAVAVFALSTSFSQELEFKNPSLESGSAGADGAVYRFPNVKTSNGSNIDALVKINGRSSSQVKLVDIDKNGMGHNKAFQPQVGYGTNNSVNGAADWWMEFEISFVNAGKTTSASVNAFDLSSLDIDGNGSRLNEWVSVYGLKSYVLESSSKLSISNIVENVLGVVKSAGTKFTGPVTTYNDIDTNATDVMTTSKFENVNTFKIRTGATASGSTSATDRMYSFWFRSFTYNAPALGNLPLDLISFTANLNKSGVELKWTTLNERNVSHFVIEKSSDGKNFADAGMVFANGLTYIPSDYFFKDNIGTSNNAVIYYRLRSVDIDGKYSLSASRVIRTGKVSESISIITYPNPAVNDVKVTLPSAWQGKQVVIDVYNNNGVLVQQKRSSYSSQTEVISLAQLQRGIYTVKAASGSESALQRIVKQ
ncbi:MAG: T9SS type A sorting domain-containing protein [Chitinophagaceae bacterium]|nr:T9SS type A sorting domain-containing protein [Chitinophagaceae bacterium]